MIKKRYHILVYCLLVCLLTGCWDSASIEEKGFVVGSAVDVKSGKVNGNYHLILTNQFVSPLGISTEAEEGAGDQKAYMNLIAGGESIFAMDEKMASQTSKIPFFEHLKVLVISRELAATPNLLADVMDMFVRDKEMRRGIKVIVADGQASSILDVLPENEQVPALYLDNLLEYSLENTSLFRPIEVGPIHEHLLKNDSFTIPQVTPEDGEITYKGGAVFHGKKDRLVGTMNKEEMTGMDVITGGNHGGSIEFKYNNHLITYRIYNAKSDISINTDNPEKLDINVEVGLEGGIAEMFGNEDLNSPARIAEIEKQTSEKAEKIVQNAINKSKDLNAEVFEISDQLRKKHYDTWQEIKNDWDEGENYFRNSDIHVHAKAKVRTAGATKKVEGKD